MENKRNLCALIPESLHAKVRLEQERRGQTLSQYVEQLLTEYYDRKEGNSMAGNSKTLAFQVSEEFFQRIERYLAAHPRLNKKAFITGLIEQALDEWERSQSSDTNA